MIRQRLLFFFIMMSIAVATSLAPISASAATAFPPANNYRVTSQSIHNMSRNPSMTNVPYIVNYESNHQQATKTFPNLDAALKWAKSHQNAVVINVQSDQAVYSNIGQPYEVNFLPAGYSAPVPSQDYATLSEAITAASQATDAYIVDLTTGAVVWSNNQGNYVVQGSSSKAQYQFLSDALTSASNLPTGNVVDVSSNQAVWQAVYQVTINC